MYGYQISPLGEVSKTLKFNFKLYNSLTVLPFKSCIAATYLAN